MLHISMKIGQTLTIDDTHYTLQELDRLNLGARLTVERDNDEQDYWVYVGADGMALDNGAELLAHSIAHDFFNYAKFTLVSDRIHDVTFPPRAGIH